MVVEVTVAEVDGTGESNNNVDVDREFSVVITSHLDSSLSSAVRY